MKLRPSHGHFIDFLDRELTSLGLNHAYEDGGDYGGVVVGHLIYKEIIQEKRFLWFKWDSKSILPVARIGQEPDPPSLRLGLQAGSLVVFVTDRNFTEAMLGLARNYEKEFEEEATVFG